PVFALVYLVAADTPVRRRIVQLLAAGLAVVVSAGWWVAAVALTPASARPYVGGSQTNSILELTLGYNGFGRLTGNETGSVGGGPGRGWGPTGWTRMFGGEVGGQIAWLLPAALIALVVGLWATRRAPRTDRYRAALLLWGGWLVVTGLIFSFMQGIFHAYYTVALAPAVGAVVGIGASRLWQLRDRLWADTVLAVGCATTAVWSYVLLGRSASWHPWLRVMILAVGLGAAVLLVLAARLARPMAAAAAGLALVAALAGPLAYALNTAASAHAGAIPSAGPRVAGTGFGGGPGGGTAPGGRGGTAPGGGRGAPPGGGRGAVPVGGRGAVPGGGRGGGGGGLLGAATPSTGLTTLLTADAGSYTWIAAAVGANNAAGYQLATGDPVLAVGGFNGSDPSPTLAQFQRYVADGKIHYFIGGSGFGLRANGGSSTSQEIAAWVAQNFTATTVSGIPVYDLVR
ncbi:MAG: hypothetical protein QOE03_3979, partial [Micromonosporaceae bacterium]|nr:hypothetical protein [Micromonosporaceae bacterium]